MEDACACSGMQCGCDRLDVVWCRYLNALQTTSQHLLRYLAAAVVVNKRRRNTMKDLIRVIEQESYEYSDPITQFLECLFVRYDFEGAQVSSLFDVEIWGPMKVGHVPGYWAGPVQKIVLLARYEQSAACFLRAMSCWVRCSLDGCR